jgi:hypothetical protein
MSQAQDTGAALPFRLFPRKAELRAAITTMLPVPFPWPCSPYTNVVGAGEDAQEATSMPIRVRLLPDSSRRTLAG